MCRDASAVCKNYLCRVHLRNVHNIIRGEPERAPNTRETYGNFAVPMYLSVYVALRRPRVYYACAMRNAQAHDIMLPCNKVAYWLL